MNEGLTGLERHEGEYIDRIFIFYHFNVEKFISHYMKKCISAVNVN